MNNILKFPKVKKSKKTKIQAVTTIMIVDFKKKELMGETEIDNIQEMIIGQWGKKPNKKVA